MFEIFCREVSVCRTGLIKQLIVLNHVLIYWIWLKLANRQNILQNIVNHQKRHNKGLTTQINLQNGNNIAMCAGAWPGTPQTTKMESFATIVSSF